MNSKEIANFRQLGDMILPRLLDANYLRSIDDYGDYALLTYHLAEPVPIQSALDDKPRYGHPYDRRPAFGMGDGVPDAQSDRP